LADEDTLLNIDTDNSSIEFADKLLIILSDSFFFEVELTYFAAFPICRKHLPEEF
jgi:hypothetical protein